MFLVCFGVVWSVSGILGFGVWCFSIVVCFDVCWCFDALVCVDVLICRFCLCFCLFVFVCCFDSFAFLVSALRVFRAVTRLTVYRALQV